jgi:hypothetical protein
MMVRALSDRVKSALPIAPSDGLYWRSDAF